MKTATEIIKEKCIFDKGDLRHASVKYYAETGKLSGSLYMAIKEAMEEYASQFKPTPYSTVVKCISHGDCKGSPCIYPECMTKDLLNAEAFYNSRSRNSTPSSTVDLERELIDFVKEYKEAWEDGMAGDHSLYNKATELLNKP